MGRTLLHLVDRDGHDLAAATRDAVKDAYQWAVAEYPHIDDAAVAGWAEELGMAMAANPIRIESPRRYAFAGLKGKILEWFRKHPGTELALGIGADLESWIGLDRKAEFEIEQTVLFGQLSAQLSERDNQILVLLLQDITSPADVASALGIKYGAAAKAIQRAKARLAAILSELPRKARNEKLPHLCKSPS